MGWSFTCSPGRKQDEIARLVKPWESNRPDGSIAQTRCLKHCWRGGRFSGTLWAVFEKSVFRDGVEVEPPERFIACFLMQCRGGCWGYKDMTESHGPCETSCPLGYLDMVPDPGYYATEWRQKVRARAAKLKRKFVVGKTYLLVAGCRPDRVKITCLRPLRGVGPDGETYRLKKRLIESEAPEGQAIMAAGERFQLGRIVATPAALEAIGKAGQTPDFFVLKHARGDWGEVDPGDAKLNDQALTLSNRLLSAYSTLLGEKIWIITEADRSVTTVLLPDDY